jgi:type II secretory pathway pseudopilin PulG
MIARGHRARSGITLTEILIAILIMGVGLISLATLFPLGLLRLREASRNSRAGLTYETAADDMDTRSLFYKPSFVQTWYGTRDPFVQDVASDLATTSGILASNPFSPNGQNPTTGAPLLQNGLPFCYDPLWRDITGVVPNSGVFDPTLDFQAGYASQVGEARFGDGNLGGSKPYLRTDPDGSFPSAYGLQRLTNFVPWSSKNLTFQFPFTCTNKSLTSQPLDVAGNVFASNDDIVFNPTGGNANAFSSVLPDMTGPGNVPMADYKYTWFVTGRQTDAGGNGTQFVGEVVLCDGRQFGFDILPGTTAQAPAGEGVYEAIFGGSNGLNVASRTVTLRWKPSTGQPDPPVRVGGWICDVTYERNTATYATRLGTTQTSFARCNWYQVSKRTDAQTDTLDATYRQMVLTVASPLKTQTLLNAGAPVHVNVALVMPSVITVFPRSFEVH